MNLYELDIDEHRECSCPHPIVRCDSRGCNCQICSLPKRRVSSVHVPLGVVWTHRDYPQDCRVVLVCQVGWPLGAREETGHDTTLEALTHLRRTILECDSRSVSGAYIVRARSK